MQSPRPLPPAVLELARRQAGLVSARQLADAGLDARRAHEKVRQGLLVPVCRGVYDVEPTPPPLRTAGAGAGCAASAARARPRRRTGGRWRRCPRRSPRRCSR
ncbi:type IV toxin-antitoxin system AbiEi family antitoxin domain-containing protein [Puerhibacterium sp. TATVAM-FAB25]|uniref:type IV toxin-antitoxin system AbiEi family antitoxin domain-containing protein n=1 Tax=Puerhibacterium sp. TATVAM-FAB25 TaxID=3093699 RepID=UPI00397E2FCE